MSEKEKPQQSIPVSKVERAAKFVKTGAKVGANYIKHYAKKAIGQEDLQQLDQDNADDIYEALSQLKGSALKVAQMMSMDKNLLPTAYTDKFTMAQYAAPPLSYPLVVKTFKNYFDKTPEQIFDTFTKDASNAASIGQVHQASLKGQKFAVKVQYPGVANSISSDLKMVKPFALRLLRLKEKDLDMYMGEVEKMLVSETDYLLELRNSQEISEACSHIPNLFFPKYYPEFSVEKILTMDWIDGLHLNEFLKTQPSQEVCTQIGQALWDFYDFQMHVLKKVHADPHPGNFLLQANGTVAILDFGCVKVIPQDYYSKHFQVIDPELLKDDERRMKVFEDLQFVYADDTPQEKTLFSELFTQMLSLTVEPFLEDSFDFGNDAYFQSLFDFAENVSKNPDVKNSQRPRGSKEALYLNRTYFGLYSMLHDLKAKINTRTAWFKK